MTTTSPESATAHPLLDPPSDGYRAATAAYNLLADVAPSAAVTARSTGEVIAAVTDAVASGLGVSVMTTGHAASGMPTLTGTVLIRPAFTEPVRVDVDRRTATIPAGSLWSDVVAVAAVHGLAALHGSSGTVGAIGYLLRGGMSFYGRSHGVAANSLRSVTVVTAGGDVVRADARTEPALFWAIRGGGGGFGIVVEVEIDLFPMWQVYTGMTAWDARDASSIAPLWRKWTETAPEAATTSLRLMNLPPLPQIPEILRQGQILVLDGAIGIETPADLAAGTEIADDLLSPLRTAATPLMDTWHVGPVTDLPMTHMDPPDPMPYIADHFLLDSFDDAGMDSWLTSAGPDSGSVLTATELRQLGGAFSVGSENGGALNRIAGQFAAFNVGVTAGPATPERVRAAQAHIRERLSAFDTGFTAPTFVEAHDSRHRALPAEVEQRVDTIRRLFDPRGVFDRDTVRSTIK